MTDKILAWVREQQLLRPGDTVFCAVSGGADSVCMLHVLLSLRETLGIELRAAHFNHHLRGEEADRDERFVRELCRTLGVPLSCSGGDVRAHAHETHTSIEEAARTLRYAFFDTLPGLIATAHTQNDNVETVLLNLTRGTGLAGLCGIPPKRGRFVRPMLVCRRAEIEEYLAQNGLCFVTDSTNLLPDARRNRLRQSVLPLLQKENPALCETVFRMCRLLQADEATLDAQAQAALEASACAQGLVCSVLAAYPDAVRTRAIRAFLAQIHAPKLSQAHICAVDRLLVSPDPSARVRLPGGFWAAREYDQLRLVRAAAPQTFAPVPLSIGGSVCLPPLGLRVRCEIAEYFPKKQNTLSTFAIKCDTIASYHTPLLLRPRQTADCLRVPGGRKTLKRLMIDRKIPAVRRGLLPVVVDAHGILGVYGIGVNLDRAAAPGERAVIITMEEIQKED